MIDDLPGLTEQALERIAVAADLDALRAVEAELLGKQGELTALKRGLGDLAPEQRRAAGQALNDARARLDAGVAERRRELAAVAHSERLAAERLDLTESIEHRRRGSQHLVTQTLDRLVDLFVGMGFTVAEGPEVETDWHNFEALNIPAAHPARGMWDTRYVDLGLGRPFSKISLQIQRRILARDDDPELLDARRFELFLYDEKRPR